ncbi:MAG: HIT family protein [Nanoarchaeota archaeon]|nr:HIT family protein [Nanoarchaeota archaeon]
MDNDACLFCRFITSKEKEKQKLYEDNLVYIMLDDFPISRGHSLIILKEHAPELGSVSSGVARHIGRMTSLVSRGLKECLKPENIYSASLNEEVKHLHVHLVPRYSNNKIGFDHFSSPRGKLINYEDVSILSRYFGLGAKG